jgi:hypothetical protein
MEDVRIFYGRLVSFTAIWYILWPFGIFYSHLWYIFPYFGMLHQEKSGNPGCLPFLKVHNYDVITPKRVTSSQNLTSSPESGASRWG